MPGKTCYLLQYTVSVTSKHAGIKLFQMETRKYGFYYAVASLNFQA